MKYIILSITFTLSLVFISSATIINVPADIDSIQGGINLANNGDTVLVQPGTYLETINFNEKNIVVGGLTLTTGDTSYISQTIIDADSNGAVVIFESGEDSSAVLNGFTITNGYFYWPLEGLYRYGSGICCINSNPKLLNLYIKNNQTSGYSGGLPGGGGLYCNNANIKLLNVTIYKNIAKGHAPSFDGLGGGISCHNSNLTLINVNIRNNSLGRSHYSLSKGSGIYCFNSKLSLFNVEISENSGHACYGAIFADSSSLYLQNVTMVFNRHEYPDPSGLVISNFSEVSLVNVIIRENQDQREIVLYDYPTVTQKSLTATHSNIGGGLLNILIHAYDRVFWLDGNIDDYPGYINQLKGDYRLQAGSPCIDAGIQDTVIVYNDEQDTLIVPPIDYMGHAPDMGAYEYGDPTKIKEQIEIPKRYTLNQNYPNPFNPTTTIEFYLPKTSEVTLKIFNILGEEVAALVSDRLAARSYSYDWDAANLASGVYLYRLEAGDFIETRKMVLMR